MSTTPQRTHSPHWAPETELGRWAVRTGGLAVAGTAALAIAFAAGLEPADSFTDDWLLTTAGVAILAVAATAAVAGGLALSRRHDRAWLVAIATGAGVLVAALMLQQVAEGLGWLSS